MANEKEKSVKLGFAKKNASKKPEKKEKAKQSDGRRNPVRYMRDVWNELKKVTWPTKKELINASIAVLIFVAVFTLLIWLMDLAITPAFQWLVG